MTPTPTQPEALEAQHANEERCESAHTFLERPRSTFVTASVAPLDASPFARWLLDDRRSAGAFRMLVSGKVAFDDDHPPHAPTRWARAYAEGTLDLRGLVARPTPSASTDSYQPAPRSGGPSHPQLDGVSVHEAERAQADATLRDVVALEASIYEPSRRDPIEKLRRAFSNPDGVVIEARSHADQSLLGFTMAVPLEAVPEVDGCQSDAHFGQSNTLYALSTTVSPTARGRGLGLVLKRALVRAAGDRRRADGSARYQWISGRNRVGATVAMMAINWQLGGDVVEVIGHQYEGSGEAAYYRLPVGAPMPPALAGDATAADLIDLSHSGCRWRQEPESYAALRHAGGLYGPAMTPAYASRWTTPAIERTRAYLAALAPHWPHVAFVGEAELRAVRAHRGQSMADATLSAGWRSDESLFIPPTPSAAYWQACRGTWVVHSPSPVADGAIDALTVVRLRHDLQALRRRGAAERSAMARRSEAELDAMAAAGFVPPNHPRDTQSHAAHCWWLATPDPAVAQRHFASHGFRVGLRETGIEVHFPWDLSAEERQALLDATATLTRTGP